MSTVWQLSLFSSYWDFLIGEEWEERFLKLQKLKQHSDPYSRL
jgi:hypothetical protein